MKIYNLFMYLTDEKLEQYFQEWMKVMEKRDLTEYEHEHLNDVCFEQQWREKGGYVGEMKEGYHKVRF